MTTTFATQISREFARHYGQEAEKIIQDGSYLYHSYWLNGQFVVDGQSGTGRILGRETQLDIQNNLHVYWTGQVPVPGGTVNGIFYQCLDPNLNWGH